MTEYDNLTEEELETMCHTRFCCESMAENTYNGDVLVLSDHVGLRIGNQRLFAWNINFCPWCSKPVNDMKYEKELIDFIVNKRDDERMNEEEKRICEEGCVNMEKDLWKFEGTEAYYGADFTISGTTIGKERTLHIECNQCEYGGFMSPENARKLRDELNKWLGE